MKDKLTDKDKLHLMSGVTFSEQGIRSVLLKINIKPMLSKIS